MVKRVIKQTNERVIMSVHVSQDKGVQEVVKKERGRGEGEARIFLTQSKVISIVVKGCWAN